MKAWRIEAGLIKRAAIRRGVHMPGQRYGRLAKATLGSFRLKALPSTLFINLCGHVGILKLDDPAATEGTPPLQINGLPLGFGLPR